MELRTCKSCKKLYNHFVGQQLCPGCTTKLDEIFRDVKEYIYDHPDTTIQEVADEFDISVKTIHSWIREERLEFSNVSSGGLPCDMCGKPIKTGKYCAECKKTMVNNLSSAYKAAPSLNVKDGKKQENKMRFIDNNNFFRTDLV